ncbi:hypothetical protein QVZ43_00545 [Marinobacter sp. chi1]|uniref:Uncharacterized protein n=1 Tax=Marinobacter suaedae TaxID=3057675 RepID=A0ABT8VW35_9GAMM|nr:hypothetical protein [Marinobacter sp. chi1]MDO3720189.1 hypothetical protein [Marinobacter sp. chi1]
MPAFHDNQSHHLGNFYKQFTPKQQKMMSCSPNRKMGLEHNIVSLKDCRLTLNKSLSEAKAVETGYELSRWGLAIVQGVKLACDLAIALGSDSANLIVPGAGAGISLAYGSVQTGVDFYNSRSNSREMMISAGKKVTANHVTVADAILETTSVGKKLAKDFNAGKLGRRLGLEGGKGSLMFGIGTVMSVLDAGHQVFELMEQFSDEGDSGIKSGISTLERAIQKLNSKIALLESEMEKCA